MRAQVLPGFVDMRLPFAFCALVAIAGCIEVKDRRDSVAAKPKIDTSSGALAVSTGTVDTTPASTVPKAPPLIGADSFADRATSAAMARALRSDTVSTLRIVDSTPAALPTSSNLDVLRREMIVPVRGFTPAMLRDSYDELRGGTRKHEALDILASRLRVPPRSSS